MQSGIDSSRLRLMSESERQPRINFNRESAVETASNEAANPSASSAATHKDLFGADGPSFRDVLDAINPLNQIPIVSDILANVTGHTPSTGSKLAGGALAALATGPIGFVATLANIIFEDGAGQSPANAVYAALTGEGATQVASNDKGPESLGDIDQPQEVASLEPAAGATVMAATVPEVVVERSGSRGNDKAVLDLYGGTTSGSNAYKKAQLLPYLRDVNRNKVI
jgi:hypothetical protein